MSRFFIILFLALGLQTFAQSGATDARLSERFSNEQIKQMTPARVAYWTYYLDNSFQIMDISAEKSTHLNNLETLDIPSIGFNGFTIILDQYQKEGATLKFKGEDKMILIKPMKQFIEEFNAYYQAQKG